MRIATSHLIRQTIESQGQVTDERLTENGSILLIFDVGAGPEHSSEVEVVDLAIVLVDPVSPFLLARLALHAILVDGLSRVEVREFLHKALIDLVVHLCQPKLRAPNLLENRPVRHQVLHGCKK